MYNTSTFWAKSLWTRIAVKLWSRFNTQEWRVLHIIPRYKVQQFNENWTAVAQQMKIQGQGTRSKEFEIWTIEDVGSGHQVKEIWTIVTQQMKIQSKGIRLKKFELLLHNRWKYRVRALG